MPSTNKSVMYLSATPVTQTFTLHGRPDRTRMTCRNFVCPESLQRIGLVAHRIRMGDNDAHIVRTTDVHHQTQPTGVVGSPTEGGRAASSSQPTKHQQQHTVEFQKKGGGTIFSASAFQQQREGDTICNYCAAALSSSYVLGWVSQNSSQHARKGHHGISS